jgi:hypothetical protein
MKRCFCFFLLLAFLWVCTPCEFVQAQAANEPTPVTPLAPVTTPSAPQDQLVSHQMNQPPPDTGDKYALSPGLVDEIQQLYLQAKKEYEAKTAHKSKDNKDHTHNGDNSLKGRR